MKRPGISQLAAAAALTAPLLAATGTAGASTTPDPVPAGSPAITQQTPAWTGAPIPGAYADASYWHAAHELDWHHRVYEGRKAAGIDH